MNKSQHTGLCSAFKWPLGDCLRMALTALLLALLDGGQLRQSRAQTPWEITPYQCRVWLTASE